MDPANEAIEHVARAIALSSGHWPSWDDVPASSRDAFRHNARHAIMAHAACGEASVRIAELERALRRVTTASCDVERDSALVHARHVLNGQ